PRCPVQVVPGERFGPVAIGMTRADVERLGLPARLPAQDRDYVSKDETDFVRGTVGPFWVELEGDRVTRIRAALKSLPKCVRLSEGASEIDLKPAGAMKIAPRAGLALFTSRSGVDVEVEATLRE
ncbi:MAG TPA: hypothetical protein VFV50_04090, partial [Bdellovibrionales bacterium]|nr:hypothetical protein [Bdellovibrionales bacterium]